MVDGGDPGACAMGLAGAAVTGAAAGGGTGGLAGPAARACAEAELGGGGGGVAGGLAVFAAAAYMRGVDCVQIPTTLLAAVDSSVGGKTAVDLPMGKNLVGAFHQPRLVLCDTEIIARLPEALLRDGAAEMIKCGVLRDEALFAAMADGSWKENLEDAIARCVSIKRDYVDEDAFDNGARQFLNFGHTFGHALEKLHNFQDLSHGEAVGIGMVLACQVGERLGVTPAGTGARVAAVLERYGLPTPDSFSWEEIVEATALDKKSDGSTLRLILPPQLGEAAIYPVTRDRLKTLL